MKKSRRTYSIATPVLVGIAVSVLVFIFDLLPQWRFIDDIDAIYSQRVISNLAFIEHVSIYKRGDMYLFRDHTGSSIALSCAPPNSSSSHTCWFSRPLRQGEIFNATWIKVPYGMTESTNYLLSLKDQFGNSISYNMNPEKLKERCKERFAFHFVVWVLLLSFLFCLFKFLKKRDKK